MSRLTFVNLPVKDLARAVDFFTTLGFGVDERFGSDETACVVVSEQAYVMLHVAPTFERYAERPVADPTTAREVLVGVSAESRADVDDVIAKVTTAGGKTGELVDQGPMYMQAFEDLDGHRWSVTYMDMSAIPPG